MADDLDTYDPVRGPARERIDAEELADPDERAAVILDRRRRQPRWFVDRFLTARDLTRAQQYTLLREADLAQLSGAGVLRGLDVTTDAIGTTLGIEPGLAVARTGESIALRQRGTITVAKLRVVSSRTRATDLVAEQASAGPITGMFLLVARPVEHARTRVAVFTAGVASQAALAESEIVEGTWFTLTPLPSAGAKDVVADGRARLAREIFVGGFDPALLTDGVPLAVLGIVGARVQWVDEGMAMREVGADATVGFGLQPRKGRLAYQAQFARHLAEEVTRRRNAGLPDGMPATGAFAALPPVGPLPRGAVVVTTTEVRQSFFPREIYLEIAIMPEDELPALLAEGLLRAPIDLQAPGTALEGVPVLIVVPVPRVGFDQQTPRMEGAFRSPGLTATGRHLASARPLDALTVLRLKNEPAAGSDPLPLDLEAWRKAVESAGQLWYVRRPQFATTSVVVPREAPIEDVDEPILLLSEDSRSRIEEAGEVARFNVLFGASDSKTISVMNDLLASDFLVGETVPESSFFPATTASVYVSGIMGELAQLARRPPPSLKVDGIPHSPVFDPQPPSATLHRRRLVMADIERTTSRYVQAVVFKPLHGKGFLLAAARSTMSTAAVVPELAVWTTTPAGKDAGGIKLLASLAAAGNVMALRNIAIGTTIPS